MAFLAMLYTRTFYGCKRLFDRLSMPRPFGPPSERASRDWWPSYCTAWQAGSCRARLRGADGGPQQVLAVLAFGYSAIQSAVTQDTNAVAWILLLVALGKILTTGLTIGSGGSGGVFGPSMVIGGCGGGALGMMFHHLWPGLVLHPASFAVVGMAGFFAAAAKTPFSTLIMVSELTGGYSLAAAVVVGLHAVFHSLRRAIHLRLTGRKPLAFTCPSRQLCPPSFGRGPGEQISFAGATACHSARR